MAQPVPEKISFPDEEENVLKYWKEIDAFKTSMKLSKGRPRYTFYDGPPFATGLPHYGHILAGTIKDVVTRWAHQSGFHVERRFGWDCHGLPVEYEIDKTLGIKGPEDVAKMGIEAYNAECRKIVMRYSSDWEHIVTRLGRWIDFEKDYKTMYPWFMETIWWVFKELYNKGLVYKGFKVMPFSTACNTPLSNFESGQNYKDVVDPAVIISFPLEETPDISMIAWTTTPWTLPSNLSLCVNPTLDYVKVKDNNTGKVYIMMEARLEALFKHPEEYTVLEKFPGKVLENKKYKPLFQYFTYMRERSGAFRILCDSYVTAESGTGVVHQAPYFGEDDQRVCLKYGIITKDSEMICPVDASGRFTAEVTDFQGLYIKDADKKITKKLKDEGRLVHQSETKHSYPFCWRSETPLIYKAVPSWFVRVEHAKEQLLNNNSQTYWVPDFVKEKRFGNWLREARDWAISRNRYWGTPIPLWVSDDMEEVVCVGSIEELKQLTGVKDINDLHREVIDKLTIPSKLGKGKLKRVSEVFDCWFESGSMPYAQVHYPFEHKKAFDDSFPADFIAEGIDQTRGWFYTLLVLSTLLFGKPPFKNLVCNGLVLASDGQKMSKRKKNYPDPLEVVHKYGADALRLYLCNSPAVRADFLRFKEEGVRDILKDVFLPWYNAYRFLMQNVERLEREEGVSLEYHEEKLGSSGNYMDRWILSFTQSLIKYVRQEMQAYRLYTVMPRLVKFVDELTNWYVKMNRKRLKGDGGPDDCLDALTTLFSVLFSMSKVMAPLIPYITELMYQNLKHLLDPAAMKGQDTRSVHFMMIPEPREDLIDTHIESAVASMQSVIELGRLVRERNTLPIRYPLKEVVAIAGDGDVLRDIQSLQSYILEELNVKKLTTTTDKEKYGARLHAEPDHRVLGAKLKQQFKSVTKAIQELTDKQLMDFEKTGEIEVLGNKLVEGDLRLMYKFDGAKGSPTYDAHAYPHVLVLVEVTPDQSMLDEGLARDVVNRIQKLRKEAGLMPTDDITVYYDTTPELGKIITNFSDFIFSTIKQPLVPYPVPPGQKVLVVSDPTKKDYKVKNNKLEMAIVKRGADGAASSSTAPVVATLSPAPVKNGVKPACKFVNVQLCGMSCHEGRGGSNQATVLLENPQGQFVLSADSLRKQAQSVFGVRGRKVKVYSDANLQTVLPSSGNTSSLNRKTLYVVPCTGEVCDKTTACNITSPVCHFANVEYKGAGGKSCKGTLLLENPRGDTCTMAQLQSQVQVLAGQNGRQVKLYRKPGQKDEVTTQNVKNLLELHSETLYAVCQ
ncbi:isoleucine--tRNA ligase, cytoplasmic-like [Mercenaria mercenaria]|uniref:isoleucine--tRNA ligase, cytoplasmic-like n=1 Tax=Mercenaria mercenaria TaxID=6596 RepID=UPI00234E8C3D|nr:isoleucine--tRNA ligase, cytoplasmic-like [Mercenaria mercenaria]XP_053378372.1 isoleucine--tRNA ligase, cytoplasmic-like [Mercenaria mercenaria]